MSLLKLILPILLTFGASLANAVPALQTQMKEQVLEAWKPPAGLQQIPIWPENAPNSPQAIPVIKTTLLKKSPEVSPGREYTQILNVSKPTITIFPPKGENTGVSLVVFPGGGFRILAIDLEGSEICDWITVRGVTCILLKYRVPKGNHYWDKDCKCHITPKFPLALQDAQRTVKLLRAKANDLGIDPKKIGVIGFSAGGYLVAQTSNIFKPAYKPVDAIDKISSRPDFAIALYPGHLCRNRVSFDTSIKVTDQTTPTFLLQAWDDPVDNICNSTMYAKALSAAGVPA